MMQTIAGVLLAAGLSVFGWAIRALGRKLAKHANAIEDRLDNVEAKLRTLDDTVETKLRTLTAELHTHSLDEARQFTAIWQQLAVAGRSVVPPPAVDRAEDF